MKVLGLLAFAACALSGLLFVSFWRLKDKPHAGSPVEGNPEMVFSLFGSIAAGLVAALLGVAFVISAAFA